MGYGDADEAGEEVRWASMKRPGDVGTGGDECREGEGLRGSRRRIKAKSSTNQSIQPVGSEEYALEVGCSGLGLSLRRFPVARALLRGASRSRDGAEVGATWKARRLGH